MFGPFLGTLFLTIIGHSEIYLYDPMRFLKGLVTPTIIFPMLLGLVFITPFGYVLGITPAFLTERVYVKFIKDRLYQSNFLHMLIYGCVLALIWAPVILVLSSLTLKMWTVFVVIQFLIILPTTVVCIFIEWRRLKKEISMNQNV